MSKEYYNSHEFNNFNEFTPFPAEEYINKNEYSKNGPEETKTKEENDNEKTTAKKKSVGSDTKKILDKMTKSATQISTGVTTGVASCAVGIAAVATVLSPIVAETPKFDIQNISAGDDSAYYAIECDGFQEDFKYFVEITAGNKTLSFPLREGFNENKIEGLSPKSEYDLRLFGKAEDNTTIEYARKKFYTLGEELPKVDFTIDEVQSENSFVDINYNINVENVKTKYDRYKVEIKSNKTILGEQTVETNEIFGTLYKPKNSKITFDIYGIKDGKQIPIGKKEYIFENQQTKKPLPSEFNAHFVPVPCEGMTYSIVNERDFRLEIPIEFENRTQENFLYRITVFDGKGFEKVVEGRERVALIDIPGNISRVKVKYETMAKDRDECKIYETFMANGELLLPSEYRATFEKVSCDSVKVLWDQNGKHEITLQTNFSSVDRPEFLYRITLYNENGYSKVYEGREPTAKIYVDNNIASLKIKYEELGEFNGQKKIYGEYIADGEIILAPPKITVDKSIKYSNYGDMMIPYKMTSPLSESETYNSLVFHITMSDGVTIPCEEWEIEAGVNKSVLLERIPLGCTYMTVRPQLNYVCAYGGNVRTVEYEETVIPLTDKLELISSEVNTDYNEAILTFAQYGPVGSKVVVKNSETGEIYQMEGNARCVIPIGSADISTVYYMADSNGLPLTAQTPLVLHKVQRINYTFDYKNPGDVLKTYNPDGSFNLYFDLNFTTEDRDLYYKIILTKGMDETAYRFTTLDAKIENLVGSYGIVYKVCKDIDGVTYVYKDVAVSGSTDEGDPRYLINNIGFTPNEQNDTLNISMQGYNTYDFKNATLVLSNGEVIALKDSDFVADQNQDLIANITVPKGLTSIKFNFGVCYNMNLYMQLKDKFNPKGSPYKNVSVELIEQPYN